MYLSTKYSVEVEVELMNIEWYRDLSITVFGFVASGVLIFLAVLLYLLYRRASHILDSVKAASSAIKTIISYISYEVIKPLFRFMKGIREGISAFSQFSEKRKGGSND